jgi:NAD(P)-dependent dehydrogenase (short-subunit alcohol dehydrogenase family)
MKGISRGEPRAVVGAIHGQPLEFNIRRNAMKVFVTGATGYIGGSIAERLVASGHDVAGLVRSQEQEKGPLGSEPKANSEVHYVALERVMEEDAARLGNPS